MLKIEIIAVGYEVLSGTVLDSNSHWLCRQLTLRGGQVRRVVQVGDEVDSIAREVLGALERQTDLIVTIGGLGPTDDDVTLAGVAAALGRPLAENEPALAWIDQRYQELAARGRISDTTVTPARRKMACLPLKGEPLSNPVGTAPGVVLHEGHSVLVCLPGVPEEMQGIFAGSLAGVLRELLGDHHYAEWVVTAHGAGESTLAPLLRQVVKAHPDVYVKSMARYPYQGYVQVNLARAGQNAEEVEGGLQAALHDLRQILAGEGITVGPVQTGPR